jgi:demethylmenaquinone methyltransferase/2-methoxy-6-polyprenyl-1,4-benzoquinol methylase
MWDKWANVWDFMLSFVGYNLRFRKKAIEKLNINRGSIVLDLACGTGLNFQFIENKIGQQGKIIAIDFSLEMLKKAEEKIRKYGWKNIELLKRNASDFELKDEVDAILCTWSMVSISNYEKALKTSTTFLRKNGRFVVLDFKLKSGIKGRIFNPIYKLIFKITNQDITREPWKKMQSYLRNVKKEEFSGLLGSHYIAVGVKL